MNSACPLYQPGVSVRLLSVVRILSEFDINQPLLDAPLRSVSKYLFATYRSIS